MNQGHLGFGPPIKEQPYINIQDQKAQNTNGGTFTSGADQTRDLNTIDSDEYAVLGGVLRSNQFILPPGVYRFLITAPGFNVNRHQAWLHNVTDNAVVKRGTSEVNAASSCSTSSIVRGRMRITSTKVFEVRHRCNTTEASDGYGVAANFGIEVYTVVELWKIA